MPLRATENGGVVRGCRFGASMMFEVRCLMGYRRRCSRCPALSWRVARGRNMIYRDGGGWRSSSYRPARLVPQPKPLSRRIYAPHALVTMQASRAIFSRYEAHYCEQYDSGPASAMIFILPVYVKRFCRPRLCHAHLSPRRLRCDTRARSGSLSVASEEFPFLNFFLSRARKLIDRR